MRIFVAAEEWGILAVALFLLIPVGALLARRDWIVQIWVGSLVVVCLLTMMGLI